MNDSRSHAAAAGTAALLCLVATATGCLHWPSETPAPRRWLLAPASEPEPIDAFTAELGLGPVEIPEYLDRSEIVERLSNHELRTNEFDIWSEPLAAGVQRMLSLELMRRVPGLAVLEFPWKGPADLEYRLTVVIARFEHDVPRKAVVLEAGWALRNAETDALIASQIQVVVEPVTGDGDDADSGAKGSAGLQPVVAAMSRSLSALAHDVTQALDAQPRLAEDPS